MASLVQDFIQDPSESLLGQCTKEQLLRIAEHYGVSILDKKLKESVKAGLKDGLFEAGVLYRQPGSSSVASMVPSPGTLTFEQQYP